MPRKPNLPNLREHDARRISAAGAAVVPSRAQFVDSGLRTTPPQATVAELRPVTVAASFAGPILVSSSSPTCHIGQEERGR